MNNSGLLQQPTGRTSYIRRGPARTGRPGSLPGGWWGTTPGACWTRAGSRPLPALGHSLVEVGASLPALLLACPEGAREGLPSPDACLAGGSLLDPLVIMSLLDPLVITSLLDLHVITL